jgi:hypothetical protein
MNRYLATTLVLFSAVAFADDVASAPADATYTGSTVSSVLSGKPLRSGTVVHGQFGWPGLSATLLTSMTDRLDLGGRFSFLYGYEGITRMAGVPGLKLQGVLRVGILERGKLNLGLRFSPGFFTYFFGGATEVGLAMPIDLAVGIALLPKLMVNFGLDLPIFAVFGPFGGVAVPVLVGGGLEYQLSNELALTTNLRVGPSVPLTGSGVYNYWDGYWCTDRFGRAYRCGPYYSPAVPAMEMLIGLTYKL